MKTIVKYSMVLCVGMVKFSLFCSVPKDYSVVQVDPKRIQLFGITSEKLQIRDLKKDIRTYGVVTVDERNISHIQTKFTGWIEQLYADFIGMPVKKGDPLFTVYSQELYATQQEYLLALRDTKKNYVGRFAQELERASSSLFESARQRLQLWDISEHEISMLEKTESAKKTMTFNSPVNGIVLNKKAFVGMNVEPGMNMYTIADLSRVWVLVDIYENDIENIFVGQTGKVYVSATPDKVNEGIITFVDYVVDPVTRTTRARFEFDNRECILKPDMYSMVEISLNLGMHLALPIESVIDTGLRKIVFVDLGEGIYEPREVELGHKTNYYYVVISGLHVGDSVVTSSQFLLDSESRMKVAQKPEGHTHH